MATNFPASLDSLTNPAAGDSLSSPSHSAQHANVNDAVEALQAKVGVDGSAVTSSLDYQVRVRPITVLEKYQSIPNAVETVITFDSAPTVIYDAPGWHSTSVNNSRITPDVAGVYVATGSYQVGGASNYTFSRFYKNGTVISSSINQFLGTSIYGSHTNVYYVLMNGTTDYLQYLVYQSSGSTQNGNIQFSLQLIAAT